MGLNHYLTSDRYLDERLDRYPGCSHGGNGRQRYADVEAVRFREEGLTRPDELLLEAWDRYRLPLAITEAHLGCTREEQARWLWEVWRGATSAREQGADVRAVTLWAIFGSFDWDSLVTLNRGHYEPGAFDLRGPRPRPTALAGLASCLARGQEPEVPVLSQPGWWRRPERLLLARQTTPSNPVGRPLLVTGATGMLGQAIERICRARGIVVRSLRRIELDVAEPAAVAQVIDDIRPWAVVNAAGYARVDLAESEPDFCFRENVVGAANLAAACARAGIPLVTFSSHLVFGGRRRSPFRESDPVGPLSVYGRTKAEAERRVLDLHPGSLVVRTIAFFGPWDDGNFVASALRALRRGAPFLAADSVVSPTYLPDLIHAFLDLLIDGESGVWHLANRGETSWVELARQAAIRAGLDSAGVEPRPGNGLARAASRPDYSALASERAALLPALEDALDRFTVERAAFQAERTEPEARPARPSEPAAAAGMRLPV